MYAYLMQDWTSLVVDETVADIIQSEADWMSFQPYQDIVFHTECKGLGKGGATDIELRFETAPAKDESLWSVMASVTLALNQTVVTPILLASGPSVPLSRWVRWRLVPTDAPASDWLATFRVHCSANAVGVL